MAVAAAEPVLTAASFDVRNDATLTLAFDRPIDVSGVDGSAIVVEDGVTTMVRFAATGGIVASSASSVTFILIPTGPYGGNRTLLDASAANGIRAADGGPPWGGAAGVVLPYSA